VVALKAQLQELTSPNDPRLAPYRGLKDSAMRRRVEEEQRLFIVEGSLALEALLRSPYALISVLVLPRRLAALGALQLPETVPVLVAEEEVMRSVTGFDVHRGLLAAACRRPLPGAEEVLAGRPASPVVVVEGVNDQENLGSIFRNAFCFGAGALFLSPTCTDPLYRRTVRVSLGSVLRLPFTRLEPWPALLKLLRNEGFSLIALTPSPGAEAIGPVAAELHGCGVALVLGGEGPGLSPEVMAICRRVRIPMSPRAGSLNVAAASAVALHRFSAAALDGN